MKIKHAKNLLQFNFKFYYDEVPTDIDYIQLLVKIKKIKSQKTTF